MCTTSTTATTCDARVQTCDAATALCASVACTTGVVTSCPGYVAPSTANASGEYMFCSGSNICETCGNGATTTCAINETCNGATSESGNCSAIACDTATAYASSPCFQTSSGDALNTVCVATASGSTAGTCQVCSMDLTATAFQCGTGYTCNTGTNNNQCTADECGAGTTAACAAW